MLRSVERCQPLADFQRLVSEISSELPQSFQSFLPFRPGDRFAPGEFTPPRVNPSDILWPGIGTFLVSAKAKEVFEQARVTGCEFVPITLDAGLPSDYFECVPTAESRFPPGVKVLGICDQCGRRNLDTSERELVMLPKMWTGHDIFYLSTSLYIFVTEKLALTLRDSDLVGLLLRSSER